MLEAVPGDGSPRRSRRGKAVAIGVGALLVAVAAAYLLLSSADEPTGPRGPVTVASFSGDGNHSSAAFTVGAGWQIQWETRGTGFKVAIPGPAGAVALLDQREPGSGVTSPVASGTLQLEITARGPWSIVVIQP